MELSIERKEIAGQQLAIAKQTTKTGLVTERTLRIGEFKKHYNLKGTEAKRQYAMYRKHFGGNGTANALAKISKMGLLLEAEKAMSAGKLQFTFAPSKVGEYTEPEPRKKWSKLSEEAIIRKLKKAGASQEVIDAAFAA